jgi:hypothetical protein
MRRFGSRLIKLASELLANALHADFGRQMWEAFAELLRDVSTIRLDQSVEGSRAQQKGGLQDAEVNVNGVFAEVEGLNHLPGKRVLHRPVVGEELAELACLARCEPVAVAAQAVGDAVVQWVNRDGLLHPVFMVDDTGGELERMALSRINRDRTIANQITLPSSQPNARSPS